MPSDDLIEPAELDPAPIWPEDDDRLEPIFLELEDWAASAASTLPAIDAVPYLDPERPPEEPGEPPPELRRRSSPSGALGSLGVHLLVLLAVLSGNSAPAEIAGAIPVRLVLEAPQLPADEPVPAQSPAESTTEAAPAARTAAPPPPRQQPPPLPASHPPEKPHPPPQPSAKSAAASATLPEIAPPAPAAAPAPPAPAAVAAAVAVNPAPRVAAAPGANASRGDYLDYLVTLTRTHIDLLPLSFLAGRRGRTILSVLVYEDGTISRISVKHSSGYPDIDARIEEMVTAVGRFPPVPDTLRKPSVELDFNLAFPDALQR